MVAALGEADDEYMPAIEIRLLLRDLSRYVYFTMRQGQEIRPLGLEICIRNAYFPGRLVRFAFINTEGHVLRHNVALTKSSLMGLLHIHAQQSEPQMKP